ncbi:MAG: glycosyltransferase [Candidatus Eisenbacteria bacterium]
MKVLAIYPWPSFWSMGEGRGSPSFEVSATSFAAHGHEAHVLMPGTPGMPAREERHGVTLHRLPTSVDFVPFPKGPRVVHHLRLLWTYVYWFVRAVPAGVRLVRELRPDVLFGMEKLGAPAASIVGRLTGLPNVTRLFGTELNVIEGRGLRFAMRYRDINAFRARADHIIMHNDGSFGDRVARSLGVDMSRFTFLQDGLDKAGFTAEVPAGPTVYELGAPAGSAVVLSVGRLNEEKRVDRLLRAVPDIVAARDDVSVLIVGDGDQTDELKSAAGRLGVSDRVVFAGTVAHDELPAVYRSAALFVTLSDRTNAFNPLFEAMLSGVPVVALDTGSTAQELEDGETGVLLGMDDLPRLAEVVVGLLNDDARRRAMAEAARKRAWERVPSIEERQETEVRIVERVVEERTLGR